MIPKSENGQYAVFETCKAYIEYLKERADTNAVSADLRRARARREKAAASKAEYELAIMTKEFMHVSVIGDVLGNFATRAAALLQAFPSKIKVRLPHLTNRDLDIIKAELADTANAVADIQLAPDESAAARD